MVGVLLAGGKGTRLDPVTRIYNKHLALVYDRPMIYYPLQTLIDMGCTEIILVSGGDHIGDFVELLKDGSEFGVSITYRVQAEAGGIAQALGCVGRIEGLFPVILGDNYFADSPQMTTRPALFFKSVEHPERFGVLHNWKITEKPKKPKSNEAVTGLYIYDERVFDVIPTLKPSKRGELEVTDINNWYLKNGQTVAIGLHAYWSDMGTPDSLLEVANYVKGLTKH